MTEIMAAGRAMPEDLATNAGADRFHDRPLQRSRMLNSYHHAHEGRMNRRELTLALVVRTKQAVILRSQRFHGSFNLLDAKADVQ